MHSAEVAQHALLPLLWSLVDVLQPHGLQAQPSLGAKEAVHGWVAGARHAALRELGKLLPRLPC